ncbi:replication initiator [Nonomuraea polychroma]|uniref:replication initiator n=1 Tax=Nonomuraea polychroma TaxID=46176 RepID=UPI0030C7BC26
MAIVGLHLCGGVAGRQLHGVCIRPVPLKRLDTHTGQWEIIDVPCGSPMDSKCPPCAKRNKQLRKAQCREGWHLDEEPTIIPDEPNEEQRWLVEFRADVQAHRDEAQKAGGDTTDLDAVIEGLDEEINAAGMRGNVLGRARLQAFALDQAAAGRRDRTTGRGRGPRRPGRGQPPEKRNPLVRGTRSRSSAM